MVDLLVCLGVVFFLLALLLPAELYKHWKAGHSLKEHPAYRDFTDPIANGHLSILICPSAAPPNTLLAPCNYIANSGRQDVPAFAGAEAKPAYPADWRANGVFFNQFVDGVEHPRGAPIESITQDFISSHDGSSLTVMLSETAATASYAALPLTAAEAEASLGFVWWPPVGKAPSLDSPCPWQRINGPPGPAAIDNAHPSSNHPGGVNVLMCDGHSRFVSDQIDYGVWCLILTPDGPNCNDPGQAELLQPSASNNYLYLRTHLLDDPSFQ